MNRSNASALPPDLVYLAALRRDFPGYARAALKILTKEGTLEPLVLNRAQLHIHAKLEAQRARTGRVRALLLKARQQGGSTYVQARFYHRVSGEFGRRAFVLTHEDKATQTIFGIGKRYHEHVPTEVRPVTGASNANELIFNGLRSGYGVATAKSKDTGRGQTFQFFHGSEVAFWPNPKEHLAGIGQAVPDLPGTEIILESTANGVANIFYEMCMDAMKGRSEYILIFTPWHWSDEYRKEPPPEWSMSADEAEYAELYGLDVAQSYWRHVKIRDDFRGDATLFAQEYPATIGEAFMGGTADALIPPRHVIAARTVKPWLEVMDAPRVIGVDPAEYGKDDTAIADRQARRVYSIRRLSHERRETIAARVALVVEQGEQDGNPVDAIMVDCTGGYGTDIVERLESLCPQVPVMRVVFSERADEPELHRNKRDEIWMRMAEWVSDEPCEIPDDDLLQVELTSPRKRVNPATRRSEVESKEAMKVRGLDSPDGAESIAVTFAYPILGRRALASSGWRRPAPNWRTGG